MADLGNILYGDPSKIKRVQVFLKTYGFYSGATDGQWSPSLKAAIKNYQTSLGIEATGLWSMQTEEATNYAIHYISGGTLYWSVALGGEINYNPAGKVDYSGLQNPNNAHKDPPAPKKPKEQTGGNMPDLGDAFAQVENYFRAIGLPELIEFGKQAIRDGLSLEQVRAKLYTPDPSNPTYQRAHEAFKARFPAIFSRMGSPFGNISPEEYLAIERSYKEIFRASLMPAGLFDDPEDFTRLIENDVSPQELAQRIEQGFDRVQQSSPEVRAKFQEYFGVSGDAALAALFLDPDKALPTLLRQVEEAAIGGAGSSFGVAVTRDLASRLAAKGVDEMQAQRGFRQIAEINTLWQETIGETTDMTAEREGVATAFNVGDPDLIRSVEARRQGRVNVLQGGGQALINSQGVRGLGSAS